MTTPIAVSGGLSSASSRTGLPISRSRYDTLDASISRGRSVPASTTIASCKYYTMCGTIDVYHIGFCPRCRLQHQQRRVKREKRCWTEEGLEEGGEVEGVSELRRLTRHRSDRASCEWADDGFDNFIEDEFENVDGLEGPCAKCLEREGYRAEFMARSDSRDPDPYVLDFVREVQGDESRELQQERSYLATANFAPHPERDYPKSRTDMTETYLQPSAANNIPQIQRWTQKGNLPFRLSDKSHASSPTTSGRGPSPIFEDPRDAEDYERWNRAKKADKEYALEHKTKWVRQNAGKREDDFEDPNTNSEGFSYPQENAGFAQQGELSSPLEYTRSNWHRPAYAQQAEEEGDDGEQVGEGDKREGEGDEQEGEDDEQEGEDDELSPLQRQTRDVVEPGDMYGRDAEAFDQGQPEASGEPLEDESEEGSEDGLEHGNEPEPEPEVENVEPPDDASQHWNEGGPDAESDEGPKGESDEGSGGESDEGSEEGSNAVYAGQHSTMGGQQYDVVYHAPGHWAMERHLERRGVHVMDHIGNFEYVEATDTFRWPTGSDEESEEDSAEEYEDDDEE